MGLDNGIYVRSKDKINRPPFLTADKDWRTDNWDDKLCCYEYEFAYCPLKEETGNNACCAHDSRTKSKVVEADEQSRNKSDDNETDETLRVSRIVNVSTACSCLVWYEKE